MVLTTTRISTTCNTRCRSEPPRQSCATSGATRSREGWTRARTTVYYSCIDSVGDALVLPELEALVLGLQTAQAGIGSCEVSPEGIRELLLFQPGTVIGVEMVARWGMEGDSRNDGWSFCRSFLSAVTSQRMPKTFQGYSSSTPQGHIESLILSVLVSKLCLRNMAFECALGYIDD